MGSLSPVFGGSRKVSGRASHGGPEQDVFNAMPRISFFSRVVCEAAGSDVRTGSNSIKYDS